MKNLLSVVFVIAFIACGQQKDKNAPSKDAISSVKKKTMATNHVIPFSVVPSLPIFDENTGVPSVEIYLSSPEFPELIYMLSDYGCSPIDQNDVRNLKIPSNAKFVFKSWFAGGGNNYYGLLKNSVVELYRQSVNEEEPNSNAPKESFNLVQKVDLKNRRPLDGFFICYSNDKSKAFEMSIYYDAKGMANSIKFEDQNQWVPLQYNTSEFKANGDNEPVTIDQYFAIYNGAKNGILNLTHTGNMDFASYTGTQDGKELKFSINQDLTMVNGEYRKEACN